VRAKKKIAIRDRHLLPTRPILLPAQVSAITGRVVVVSFAQEPSRSEYRHPGLTVDYTKHVLQTGRARGDRTLIAVPSSQPNSCPPHLHSQQCRPPCTEKAGRPKLMSLSTVVSAVFSACFIMSHLVAPPDVRVLLMLPIHRERGACLPCAHRCRRFASRIFPQECRCQ